MKKTFKNSKATRADWEEDFYNSGNRTQGFKTKRTTKRKYKKHKPPIDAESN